MIYKIDGSQLQAPYNIDAEGLNRAYNLDGEIVFDSHQEYDYTQYTISSVSGFAVGQGIAIYQNTLASWVASSPAAIRLYNINTGVRFATLNTESTLHGNDLSFSSEKFSPDDDYPLLYVVGSPSGGYRITDESATLIKEISTPGLYGMKIAESFNGNELITIGYTLNSYQPANNNKIIIATWDMNDMTEVDGSFVPRLKHQVERDYLYSCIQGADYHDGLLWVICGLGGTNAMIFALDVNTGEVIYTIDTGATGEPEGLAWGFNNTDGWFLMWWQKKAGGMKKCTFAILDE